MADFEILVDGVDFGEGPRWRDGTLWYSDFYQQCVYRVTEAGERTVEVSGLDQQPSGLGWLPDGRLLVVSMIDRRVLRREADGQLVEHGDLSGIAEWHCNDMVVGPTGDAYVGNFGFDLEAGTDGFVPGTLALVRPDGTVVAAAGDMWFANGSVITTDGTTLIVGETFGGRYSAFTIADDGSLHDRRVWAEVPGTAPDGCAADAEGAIWFADAIGQQVVRVREGGEVTHRLATGAPAFACTLGGAAGDQLYVLTAPGSLPAEAAGRAEGNILVTTVDVPAA